MRHFTSIPRLLLGAALLLPLSCGAALAGVSAVDDSGRLIALDHPARRIVSLAPHTTELLFSAGAGSYIVGTAHWSDFPEAATRIPRVGDTYSIDLERIVDLQPDLVVAWRSGNGPLPIGRLLDLGFPVFISEPHSLAQIGETVRRLGELAGTAAAAEPARARFMARLHALGGVHPAGKPVSVFYQIWDDPIFTVNGEHIISEIIRRCGGQNVFAGLPGLSTRIGREAVLAADPEVIIASGVDASRPAWLDHWKQWPSLAAVRRNRMFHVPPHLLQRHTVRILDGAEQVCTILRKVGGRR